jgi:hypothetical protein
VAAHEAAPGVELGGELRGGENISVDGAKHMCFGCGLPAVDPERICVDCRHTDAKYGTLVTAPGMPCPDCGAE